MWDSAERIGLLSVAAGALVAAFWSAECAAAQASGSDAAILGTHPIATEWRSRPELARRWDHAMAYDPLRQRVVLFGGFRGTQGILNDTWEWDGARWDKREPKTRPPSRCCHEMVFDPVRRSVLMFGGTRFLPGTGEQLLDDLWEWDGREWSQIPFSAGPSARKRHSMALDRRRQRVVLFGGAIGGLIFPVVASDTWEWDGQRWQSSAPATSPPARHWAAMAYHGASQSVVLFSGGVIGNPYQDTWAWNGLDWRLVTSGQGPAPVLGGGLAEDPNIGDLVFYGGVPPSGVASTQTWSFDGTTWRVIPASTPPPFDAPALVADSARRKLVMLDGSVSSTPFDTWTWDGTDWSGIPAPPKPEGVFESVYVPGGDHVLLVGLATSLNNPPIRTWQMSEDGYVEIVSAVVPPYRRPGSFSLAYHEASGNAVLMGGRDRSGFQLNDTWLWDGSTWTEHTGGTRPPRNGPMAYDPGRRRLVMAALGEFWEWEPVGGWVQRTSPPSMVDYLAYDPERGVLVAVPIRTSNTVFEWDGVQWSTITSNTALSTGGLPHLMYARSLGGVVAIGNDPDRSWVWNGVMWRELAIPSIPSIFSGTKWAISAAYDAGRQKVLAFYQFSDLFESVTELEVRSLTASQPEPRLGEPVSLDAVIPSQAGRLFVLGLSGGEVPGVPLRQVPGAIELLPVRNDPLLLLSLRIPLVRTLDARGRASLPLQIPNAPQLLGHRVYGAGFTLGPGLAVGWITNAESLFIVP